jgi:hypothetical protein
MSRAETALCAAVALLMAIMILAAGAGDQPPSQSLRDYRISAELGRTWE